MSIYLDHNAMSLPTKEHLNDVLSSYLAHCGNPSSPHEKGRSASVAIFDARRAVANSLNVSPSDIIFLSGASEANNLGTKGVLESLCLANMKESEAITSTIEHASILEPLEFLEKNKQLNVVRVSVNQDGFFSLKEVIRAITPKTKLITLMLANNEIGTIQPIKEFADWLNHRRWAKNIDVEEYKILNESLQSDVTKENLQKIHFHVDAVQGYGKIQSSAWSSDGIDSFSISPHKIGALSGIGALFLRKGRTFTPSIMGGGQEKKRRSGTENLFGIISFGKIAEEVNKSSWWEKVENIKKLRDRLSVFFSSYSSLVRINTPNESILPNTLHISLNPQCSFSGEDLIVTLDMKKVFISSGSACSSSANRPSHVVIALNKEDSDYSSKNSIRFSLSINTKEEEIIQVEDILKGIFK